MSSSSQDQSQDRRHVETREEHEGQTGQNTVADRLQELYKLIDGVGIAMVTSRRPRDGRLVSRALCVGKRVSGVDLAFIIPTSSKMVDDIKHDPHCNAAFYRDRTGEWVSVSGIASVRSIADPEGTGSLPTADNTAAFKQLVLDTWSSDIAAWFPEGTDPVSSPNVSVLLVRAISATYATTPSAFTSARVLFDLGVSALTGHVQPTAQVSMHRLGEADMAAARVLESHESGTKVVKDVKEEIKVALVRGIHETQQQQQQQQVQKVEE